MYSLKQRLQRNLFATVTLAMVLLLCVLFAGIRQLTESYVTSRLQHDAESVLAVIEKGSDGLWYLPAGTVATIYSRARSGHYYVVEVDGQKIRSRSLFDADVALPDIAMGRQHCYTTGFFASEKWLACIRKVRKQDSEMAVWVAEDIAPLQQAERRFMLFAAGAVVFCILLLLLIQYGILRHGFGQLERVREAIRQMNLGSEKIDSGEIPLEILPLVEEISRLLSQLRQRVNRSRNALGNMAHEIKRPLQRYQSQLERMVPEQRIEGDSILQDIRNVIERELKRSRIVGEATPGRHTVVNEDLPVLVKVLDAIYPDKKIEAAVPEGMVLPHDRDDMLELLGNLLDNACKYAKKTAYISFLKVDHGWQIVVEDDGQGVSPADLELITGRGVRLDESRQGHGLGLSICKDIVESYSGSLAFGISGKGGLRVTVFLPYMSR